MKKHTFHIPVMGIGFTIDTPLKVSQYGISSVISLVDDVLMEKLRKVYSEKFELPYNEITNKIEDFRAKRITSYLNMINELAEKKFEEFKNSASEMSNDIKDYFNMLPDTSEIKKEFHSITEKYINVDEIKNWFKENLTMGNIDVNIMTKIDKDNYAKGEKLSIKYNDAHAALRGFATSNLHSSVVLSAGMNPRLYSYIENFDDFFPDKNGYIKKKIILKVSDYRSALIQGKFFAKKGLWVSEYRIESGLNCGGHAFATDGFLMGPILAEFKENRSALTNSVHELLVSSLEAKNKIVPEHTLPLKITAQGGVGTSEEHDFLIDHYGLDSVGWGSPFLLVPEVSNIDDYTLNEIAESTEEDLYLSNISPLGVPFNSLRGNTKDIEKYSLASQGKPGSNCPKRFLASNNEFGDKSVCTASSQYLKNKVQELKESDLSESEYENKYNRLIEKSCICVGLGTSALLVNKIDTKVEGQGVSVCPGPNMAYFSKIKSLKEMVDHIYGRSNVITRTDRPNMFIKELQIYIDYLKNIIEETGDSRSVKQEKYLLTFAENLKEGISYYQTMFDEMKHKYEETKTKIFRELESCKHSLQILYKEIENRRTSVAVPIRIK